MSDHQGLNQVRRQKQWRAALLLALLVFSTGLGACGKKPGRLDPPPDVTEEDKFPRSYPDPDMDPSKVPSTHPVATPKP